MVLSVVIERADAWRTGTRGSPLHAFHSWGFTQAPGSMPCDAPWDHRDSPVSNPLPRADNPRAASEEQDTGPLPDLGAGDGKAPVSTACPGLASLTNLFDLEAIHVLLN